ncbi:hypothetical protein SKAU_G00328680 [Synaphobranchus kaupii]|uniref:Uncharacterized protein n=1 Tax=Synaphobranchus kaupii TaxID=118154 RepID=A0A9Q1EQ72_SYNKA|nr:hypothetical protein SKAU_G00328680 [Synaphobranchus kaupii]
MCLSIPTQLKAPILQLSHSLLMLITFLQPRGNVARVEERGSSGAAAGQQQSALILISKLRSAWRGSIPPTAASQCVIRALCRDASRRQGPCASP